MWLLKLRGMDDPEAVEALAGQTLFMHASERPALADKDEFYVQELVGMQVGILAACCMCRDSACWRHCIPTFLRAWLCR